MISSMPDDLIHGTSGTWLDYILRHQLAETRPASVVDFGAGDGKNGRMIRDVLGTGCRTVAIEGFTPTVRMLESSGLYDEVHEALIQAWSEGNTVTYDLALFGDVLEHLTPREIHRVIRNCLPKFRELIVVVPLCHNQQDAVGGNRLEIHRSYVTPRAFRRYRPVEQHIVHAGYMDYMNVRIDSRAARIPWLRLLPQRLFHLAMLVLQPVGLARPLAWFLRHKLNRFKWLIRC